MSERPRPELIEQAREAMRNVMESHTRCLSSGTGKITVCTCNTCKTFSETVEAFAQSREAQHDALREDLRRALDTFCDDHRELAECACSEVSGVKHPCPACERDALQKRVGELEGEWVPVGERLPPKRGDYLCYRNRRLDIWAYNPSDPINQDSWMTGATHWRELPSPPLQKGRQK